MKKYFQNLFEFNSWANSCIVKKLFLIDDEKDDSIKLMSHIISAQDTWLERLKETQNYIIDIWEIFTIQELQILSNKSSKEWKKFIAKISDQNFQNICNYKNSIGQQFSHSYHDIFTHVINHSTYHRAQINTQLKLKNIEPAKIDYIIFDREKLN